MIENYYNLHTKLPYHLTRIITENVCVTIKNNYSNKYI